jgi:replicative DNA helicase
VAERALEVAALDRLSPRSTSALVGEDVPGVLREAKRDTRRGLVGLATGWRDLDRLSGGLPVGLHVLLGRAGMGKTSFVTGLAHNVASARAEPRNGVAIFSLEMPRAQLITRLLSAESNVPLDRIERADVSPHHWPAVEAAARVVGDLPIWMDDSSRTTVPEFRAKLRMAEARLRARGARLSLAIVDYLQLMGGSESAREERVAENSKRLVEAAKQFEIPILVTSQMNRESDGRGVKPGDRRPRLSDARESGQIEQDGGRIFGLYRDEYYDPESPDKGLAEIHVLKCRQGGHTGSVKVRANEWTMTFKDLSRDVPPEGQPIGPADDFDEYDTTGREMAEF